MTRHRVGHTLTMMVVPRTSAPFVARPARSPAPTQAVLASGQLLTVPEVATRLRTTPKTVRRWVRTGRLAAFLPGGAKVGYRIAEADLVQFLQAHRLQARTEEQPGGRG